MAQQLDATVLGAVAKLLDKLTDKHETHQDAACMQQVKAFCKQSDENITWFSTALLHRLKDEHAQTRLHVVNIADQLFQRSKAFRNHLTSHFTEFLELSLGFRHDKPLPGPSGIANQLRERTLEIVEQWNDKFGSTYKQVALGFNYLKNNMAIRFPEVRARAAAAEAEQQEREARSQALLQDKYRQICRGLDAHMADMKATLTQITGGFDILEGTAAHNTSALVSPNQSDLKAPDDEIVWETVEEAAMPAASPAASPAAAGDDAAEEGLSAYAMDTIPEDLLKEASAATGMEAEDPGRVSVSLQNPDPAVVETLQGLDKVLVNRHLPRLQEWLRVFIKVDVGEVASQARNTLEQQLRSCLDLQNQLKLSHTKLESLSQQLGNLPVQETSQHAPEAASQAASKAPFQANSAKTEAPMHSKRQTAHATAVQSPKANSVSVATKEVALGERTSKAIAALMEELFGSDEEDGDDSVKASKIASQRPMAPDSTASDSRTGQTASRLTQAANMAPAASAAHTDKQTQAQVVEAQSTLPGSRLDISQNPSASSSLGTTQAPSLPSSSLSAAQNPNLPSSSSQRMVDPTAPKRSISFSSNAAWRHQPSSSALTKHRRDAFDAAADAAITEALAQRAAATTGAETSASAQRAELLKAPADSSEAHVPAAEHSDLQSSEPHGSKAATKSPVKSLAGAESASAAPVNASSSSQNPQHEQAKQVTGQQHGISDTLAGLSGSAQPGQTSSSSAFPPNLAQSEEKSPAQEAPKVITRPSQAEKAPKLKLGSRLAASMAKLQAANPAGNVRPEAASPVESVPAVKQERGKKSAIPDDVKRALLAKAPVVAHANDLVYWDSNNARALVNARGMEYQNHWGAHDPDVELPSEQLNAFFGTRAEYWTPSAAPKAPRGHPQQPVGHPKHLLEQGQGQYQKPGSEQSQRAAAGPSASQEAPLKGSVRAQRAADRAHNEAVIGATDEQVAQALADEEAQHSDKAASGHGRGSKRKAQPTVRERLAKKLLSGKARGRTLGEVESAADAKFQEVNSNRWQATHFP